MGNGDRTMGNGDWAMGNGDRSIDSGNWAIVNGLLCAQCSRLTAHCFRLTADCFRLIAHCFLLTADCLRLTAHWSRLTAHCLLLTAYCLLFAGLCPAQDLTRDRGVEAHPQIDAVYAKFSEAYRTLNADLVTGLYSESAAYLPPDSEILIGRDAIKPTFASFFDWIRQEGRTMTISFRIVQRQVDKRLAYDVGIYTIRQFKDGKEVGVGDGKFTVVAARGKDRVWRFQVDGYSQLRREK